MPTRTQVRRARDLRDEAIAMAVAQAVHATWSRLLGAAIDRYAALKRQGMPPVEIAQDVQQYLGGLSVKADEMVAREASTIAYGKGRGTALVEVAAASDLEFSIRTNVLDKNTCETCWDLDGTVVAIGSDDYYELEPPARCQGGDLCRCEYAGVPPEVISRRATA